MGAYRQRGGMFQKPTPPAVKQPMVFDPDIGGLIISPTCWAAALSSWLRVARNTERSVEYLVEYFASVCNPDSSLKLHDFDEVAETLFVRMDYEIIPSSDPWVPDAITWEYLYDKLTWSHVYLIKIPTRGPAHVVVVHGVSKDSRGNEEIHVMDPLKGKHLVGPLGGFLAMTKQFVVGWSKGQGTVGLR